MIDESAYLSHEILVKCPVYRKVTEITFFSSQKEINAQLGNPLQEKEKKQGFTVV